MPRDLIIKSVTLIDGTGADPSCGVDVVIHDGKFEAVLPASDKPDERGVAGALDGRDKFLIPGLWEAHTHLRPLLSDDEQASQAALDTAMRDYLAHGITIVVDLGGPIEPFQHYRRRLARDGAAGRAQVLFAGPSFTGVNGWPLALHHNPSLVNQIGRPADVSSMLSAQLDRQPDVVKIIYDGEPGAPDKLPREALSAIVAEAHQRNVQCWSTSELLRIVWRRSMRGRMAWSIPSYQRRATRTRKLSKSRQRWCGRAPTSRQPCPFGSSWGEPAMIAIWPSLWATAACRTKSASQSAPVNRGGVRSSFHTMPSPNALSACKPPSGCCR